MKQMSLSEVCKQYGFTRRVIQGYEKEGLIKHSGKNKYGYLMYNEDEVKKIAYIRYLQINGLTLKEISKCVNTKGFKLDSVLQNSNLKHEVEIKKISKLINKNEQILKLSMKNGLDNKEEKIFDIIMEELRNVQINRKTN